MGEVTEDHSKPLENTLTYVSTDSMEILETNEIEPSLTEYCTQSSFSFQTCANSSSDNSKTTRKGNQDISKLRSNGKDTPDRNLEKWGHMSDFHVSSDSSEAEEPPSPNTYTAAFYRKVTSLVDGFKGYMFSNMQPSYQMFYRQRQCEEGSDMDPNINLSITQRLICTMDNLFRTGSPMERLVAFIPSFSVPICGFDVSSAFVPEHENLVECFALFIQDGKQTEELSSIEGEPVSVLDKMGESIRCEIINKVSNTVISESGPYQCVFEENIDSDTSNDAYRGLLDDMVVKSGRLRFFQTIKSLGKYRESFSRRMSRGSRDTGEGVSMSSPQSSITSVNSQAPRNFLKNRFAMLSEYLARKSEGTVTSGSFYNSAQSDGTGSGMLKWYFSTMGKKRSDEPIQTAQTDENARHRLEEHIMLHTGHWDEFQYDHIEIVLRDDNDSVVKLPYSCAVM